MDLGEAKTKVFPKGVIIEKVLILGPLNPFASPKMWITKHFDVRPNFTHKLCKTRQPRGALREFIKKLPIRRGFYSVLDLVLY